MEEMKKGERKKPDVPRSVKGMDDILPPGSFIFRSIEETARRIFEIYGYAEVRTPIVEEASLFERSVGETSDIVEKQMYTFLEKGADPKSLALRPEGTAPAARALVQHGLARQGEVVKWFYHGPMFRYEREQLGRRRQFYQIGAELFGSEEAAADAELMEMLMAFIAGLGIHGVELHVNSIGCPACRPAYREKLLGFLESVEEVLCEDCKRRLQTNPLRILDCKQPECISATTDAPAAIENLCEPCSAHFALVRKELETAGVEHHVNPRMVRGLDYYTRTTFEAICGSANARTAVAAGGRYDGLVEQLGGPRTPAVGFAAGVERLAMLLEEEGKTSEDRCEAFVAVAGAAAESEAKRILRNLRKNGIKSEMDLRVGSLRSQMRRADRLKCPVVLMIGEDEIAKGVVTLRKMADGSQEQINQSALIEEVRKRLT